MFRMTKEEFGRLKNRCNCVQFNTVYWTQNAVGILTSRCNRDLIIEITYTNKKGARLFRNPFFIKSEIAQTFPIESKKFGSVYVVPIDALTEIFIKKHGE